MIKIPAKVGIIYTYQTGIRLIEKTRKTLNLQKKTMKNIYILSLAILFSCTAKKGVFYDEISNVLVAKYINGMLVLKTGNSKTFSAYLIYDVKAKADIPKKKITITAYQAQKKDNNDRFEIDLKKLGVTNIQEYEIIWVDPDGKNINIQLQKDNK